MSKTEVPNTDQNDIYSGWTIAEYMAAYPYGLVSDTMDRLMGRDDSLTKLAGIVGRAETLLRVEVGRLKSAGETWQEIGRQLGITKQAAQQRFGSSV